MKRSALDYALLLLRFRLRSKQELINKLKEHRYKETEIEDVIKKLVKRGLVDDERFIKSYIESRLAVGRRGKHLIALELLKLGIAKDKIDIALKGVSKDEELSAANTLLKGRLRQWAHLDALTRKRRAISLLQRRGFTKGVLRRIFTDPEQCNTFF